MTRGDSSHLNFQLQKVDWEPSGRQNWGQMMEFWKILYIHFIRDPKGITYVRFILKIESDAKMACPIAAHLQHYCSTFTALLQHISTPAQLQYISTQLLHISAHLQHISAHLQHISAHFSLSHHISLKARTRVWIS